jgi:hypothetical protein
MARLTDFHRQQRPGPQVPEVLIEASANIVEKAESM